MKSLKLHIKLFLTGAVMLVFYSSAIAQNKIPTEGWKARPGLVDTLSKRNSEVNYYESKVPSFNLPDLLKLPDGNMAKNPEIWQNIRRPEILDLFSEQMFGYAPIDQPADMNFKVYDITRDALNGLAIRKQIRVNFTSKPDGPFMDILLYLPKELKSPVALFLGLNFQGNHTIHNDPAITITSSWLPNQQGRSRE